VRHGRDRVRRASGDRRLAARGWRHAPRLRGRCRPGGPLPACFACRSRRAAATAGAATTRTTGSAWRPPRRSSSGGRSAEQADERRSQRRRLRLRAVSRHRLGHRVGCACAQGFGAESHGGKNSLARESRMSPEVLLDRLSGAELLKDGLRVEGRGPPAVRRGIMRAWTRSSTPRCATYSGGTG